MTDTERKAFKLIEALAQKCDIGDRDGDHNWRECRRCLAVREFDGTPKATRELMQALLSLRTVWTENIEPFLNWAQPFLDGGRWGGHDVFDAIKTELLEARAERDQLQTALREVHMAFNVAMHRVSGLDHRLPACAGPDCAVCRELSALLPGRASIRTEGERG